MLPAFPPALIALPPQAQDGTQEMLALIRGFEIAFKARDLGSFKNPSPGKIKLFVEHSIRANPRDARDRYFLDFGRMEKWLRSRETKINDVDWAPFREVRTGAFKSTYEFEYSNDGISHNSLYISTIKFSRRSGKLIISSVVLYDGD